MHQEKIIFTSADLAKLKKLYKKVVAEKKETLEFNGHIFLTSYAKYLIEYLDNKFKEHARNNPKPNTQVST